MTRQAKKKTRRPVVFNMATDQCVWSRAGVIKPIACMNAFDCLGCALDKKLQADFEARQQLAGGSSMDHTPPRMRMLMKQLKCRHMLSGRVSYKLCAHGYNCVKCPYDQMIEDSSGAPALTPPVCESVSGFQVARDYYYHTGHTWARVEYGGRVRVGIDDFALRMLGPQDEIQLPKLGSRVGQNRHQATLVRDKNEAETLSPLDGWVVAVNPNIKGNAATANRSPYGGGWLMVLQPTDLRKNLKNLFYGTESMAWLDDEAVRLTDLLSEDTGYQMAAAGGEAIDDIYGSIPGIDWHRLVEEFLS